MWLQKLDSSNSAGCIQYWKKLTLPIQNAPSWEHWELEEATFLLRLLKKALMALPVLYLSTWGEGTLEPAHMVHGYKVFWQGQF